MLSGVRKTVDHDRRVYEAAEEDAEKGDSKRGTKEVKQGPLQTKNDT
jgi:hypothetical protein